MSVSCSNRSVRGGCGVVKPVERKAGERSETDCSETGLTTPRKNFGEGAAGGAATTGVGMIAGRFQG